MGHHVSLLLLPGCCHGRAQQNQRPTAPPASFFFLSLISAMARDPTDPSFFSSWPSPKSTTNEERLHLGCGLRHHHKHLQLLPLFPLPSSDLYLSSSLGRGTQLQQPQLQLQQPKQKHSSSCRIRAEQQWVQQGMWAELIPRPPTMWAGSFCRPEKKSSSSSLNAAAGGCGAPRPVPIELWPREQTGHKPFWPC